MPKLPTCQLALMASVACDEPPTFYFNLVRPFVPTTMAGSSLPIFPTIDACAEHADRMEAVLKGGGYQPKRLRIQGDRG
jgi:hypothetical protein